MADNKAFQRKANIALVMQSIRINKNISRIDISRELGLDRSTITNIVSKLIDNGVLLELADVEAISKGGRKPVLLGINRNFGQVLGLEIGDSFYKATLLSIDGSTIWNKCGEFNSSSVNDAVQIIYKDLEQDIKMNEIPLLGIGVGIPGQVNTVKNRVLKTDICLKNQETIENFMNMPVIIDNDSNCCAWGILEDFKQEALQNFLYTRIDIDSKINSGSSSNIGFGIVVNGEVYYGSNFSSGEIISSMVDGIKSTDTDEINAYMERLVERLSIFVAFLNPSHIFLGGEFVKYQSTLNSIFKDSSMKDRCKLAYTTRPQFDVSFGAASMFIERLFKVPVLDSTGKSLLSWEIVLERIKKIL